MMLFRSLTDHCGLLKEKKNVHTEQKLNASCDLEQLTVYSCQNICIQTAWLYLQMFKDSFSLFLFIYVGMLKQVSVLYLKL